eukprot:snap_masked-scaffold_10-processed-gene-13.22-mRNA-1 protein AED:1.00 eAED:1.00 QI:0/0/0/0/1/1/3/0/306
MAEDRCVEVDCLQGECENDTCICEEGFFVSDDLHFTSEPGVCLAPILLMKIMYLTTAGLYLLLFLCYVLSTKKLSQVKRLIPTFLVCSCLIPLFILKFLHPERSVGIDVGITLLYTFSLLNLFLALATFLNNIIIKNNFSRKRLELYTFVFKFTTVISNTSKILAKLFLFLCLVNFTFFLILSIYLFTNILTDAQSLLTSLEARLNTEDKKLFGLVRRLKTLRSATVTTFIMFFLLSAIPLLSEGNLLFQFVLPLKFSFGALLSLKILQTNLKVRTQKTSKQTITLQKSATQVTTTMKELSKSIDI